MSTALQGELRAIEMALQYVETRTKVTRTCAVITDSKAALEKIRSLRKPTNTTINIRELIRDISSQGTKIN